MRVLCVLSFLSVLTACGASSSTPPAFELRDLTVSKVSSQIGTDIRGSASLVSSDERLKGQTIVVLIQWKASDEDNKVTQPVVVTDGTGMVKIFGYESDRNAQVPTYSDWQVIGYYDLSPASLTVK